MPFTLSHAAAALPLRRVLRGAAVFPALVIGCFIPDVPYFLPDPLYQINAHELPGLVLFGIPCGWAIYVLWRHLLLAPTIALLPKRYACLLLASASGHAQAARWWSTTLSFLAGAISHVVWDAFTHRGGLVVHALPALARPAVHVGEHALPPYLLFQHGSTVVGIVWLALYARRRLREIAMRGAQLEVTPQLSAGAKVAVLALLSIGAACLVWGSFSAIQSAPLKLSAYNLVCRSVSSAAIVAVIYALAWHACGRIGPAGPTHRR